ncbi:unnamed protein product [Rhodiola kirilowii]
MSVSRKYLAFRILLINKSGLLIILQHCLANRARFTHFKFLKPIPPFNFSVKSRLFLTQYVGRLQLGRRDGLVSSKSHAYGYGKLPHPDFTLADLNAMFGANKLTQTDMIALSGAHTIGFSHCRFFADRINSTPVDPTLNASYAAQLQNVCPVNVDPLLVVDMDPSTPRRFDNSYFPALVQRKGLLKSDSVLFEDEMTRGTVTKFAQDADAFFKAFVEAMLKLGRVGVKTDSQGEIRQDCSRFNS